MRSRPARPGWALHQVGAARDLLDFLLHQTLDDGRQIEIGEDLSNADREWLAEVIRAWIPPLRFTPDSPEGEGPSESIQQG